MDKNKFRTDCIDKLKANQNKNRLYNKKKINNNLSKLLNNLKSKKILFYYPLKLEADILPTLKKFRKKSTIFTPFIIDVSFKMVKFRLPISKNRFGIYQSRNSNYYKQQIDTAIIPVIGVDGSFKRIGFGKGMYDRFFAHIKNRPIMIFLQNQKCHTKKRLCDTFDIQADFYITPHEILKVKNDRDNNSMRISFGNK